jgi:hypothetical protein
VSRFECESTRDEAGNWNYFDVIPEVIYEAGGEPVNLDDASAIELPISQGADLAQWTLALAGRYYEADSCALESAFFAAYDASGGSDPNLSYVAACFIDEILDAAVRGRNRS